MKYELERIEEEVSSFKPFKLTLIFETQEEYSLFHDKTMGLLTQTGSHQFHGDIYKIGNGQIESASGKI